MCSAQHFMPSIIRGVKWTINIQITQCVDHKYAAYTPSDFLIVPVINFHVDIVDKYDTNCFWHLHFDR